MQLRWTEEAACDLEQIAVYLFELAPGSAEEVVRRVYEAPSILLRSPWLGRPGRKEGTRELVLSPLPNVLIYRVDQDVIHIARILHGAQRWL